VAVRVGRDGSQVVVAVSDDGPGIPADRAEAVFSPGVSHTGGAGLGLPLARRLARAAEGDVVAVPAAHGARVELRLPATGS
jgi:signal transduction histidine kinase